MTAVTATPGQQSILNAFSQLVAARTPYVLGGMTKLGADCSGAVKWAFAQAGFNFGARTSQDQANLGVAVPLAGANLLANALPADVLIFSEPGEGPDSHEALYAGDGMDFEESHPGTNAREIPVDTAHLVGIRRLISPTGTALAGVNGAAVNVAGTAAPVAATTTSILSPLSAKSWTSLGAEILAVGAGLGLVVLGAYKTAAPQ